MASLLHLTRSRSGYRFDVVVSKVMLILPASLAESKEAVRIHCVLRRNNKLYRTGHLALTAADGTLSGDFASTLSFPCTLYSSKDAFDKKAFSVAVLLEDKPLEFTGTIDLAAFASHEKAFSADTEVKLSPAGSISFHVSSHPSDDGDEADGEVDEEIVSLDRGRREPSGQKIVPLRLLSPPPVVTSSQGNALFAPIDHKDNGPMSPTTPGSPTPLSPTIAGMVSPPPVPPSSPFSPSSPLSPDGARSPGSPLPFAFLSSQAGHVAPLAVYPSQPEFTHVRRHSLSGPVQESPKPQDRTLNPQKPPSPTNADKSRPSPSSRTARLSASSGFVATVPLSQAAAARAFQRPADPDMPSSGNLSAPAPSAMGTSPRMHSAEELDALNSVSSILMGADPSKR